MKQYKSKFKENNSETPASKAVKILDDIIVNQQKCLDTIITLKFNEDEIEEINDRCNTILYYANEIKTEVKR